MCQACEAANQVQLESPHPTSNRINGTAIFALLAVGLAVLLLVTWGPGPASTVRQQQTVNAWTITVERPQLVQVNHAIDYTIEVRDVSGQSINDAQVYMDLVMPLHPMGQNQPIATRIGDGTYQVTSLFTMDGEWTVRVVARAATAERAATFPVLVQP